MGLVAAASISSQSMILGHLMVHELGHLLLDTDSHSPRGIMSSPWCRSELQRATLD